MNRGWQHWTQQIEKREDSNKGQGRQQGWIEYLQPSNIFFLCPGKILTDGSADDCWTSSIDWISLYFFRATIISASLISVKARMLSGWPGCCRDDDAELQLTPLDSLVCSTDGIRQTLASGSTSSICWLRARAKRTNFFRCPGGRTTSLVILHPNFSSWKRLFLRLHRQPFVLHRRMNSASAADSSVRFSWRTSFFVTCISSIWGFGNFRHSMSSNCGREIIRDVGVAGVLNNYIENMLRQILSSPSNGSSITARQKSFAFTHQDLVNK